MTTEAPERKRKKKAGALAQGAVLGAFAAIGIASWPVVSILIADRVQPPPPPPPIASALPAPAPSPAPTFQELRFPDVPASACADRKDCLPLDATPQAARIAEVCSESEERTTGGQPRRFTLEVGGITGFCQSSLVAGTCHASCAMRFVDIDLASLQQRTEDVVQAFRDLHGREATPGRWTSHQDRWQRSSRWSSGPWRLEVRGDWLPPVEGRHAPNDIHVIYQVVQR
jgi:hypothetical protein